MQVSGRKGAACGVPGWRSACIRLSTNSILRYTSSPLKEEEEEVVVVNVAEVEVCG